MGRLCIFLLGGYSVSLDGNPLCGFDSDKSRLLLAYLAVEARQPQRREKLVGLFWPEHTEAHARSSLSQALYNIRQLLGERGSSGALGKTGRSLSSRQFLLSDALTVQFNQNSSYHLDTNTFHELLNACQIHDHRYLEACPDCMQRLSQADALYQGDFLEGMSLKDSVSFEEWMLVQREHFHRKVLEALQTLAVCHEYRGDFSEAIKVAQRQVAIDPLWEIGQRQLMRLLVLMGQPKKALIQYQDFKSLLASRLEVPPEKETQALAKQISLAASVDPAPVHLPPVTFPLIGRKDALAVLRCYLHDPSCRLLTIFGIGGCGKTRLALEVAWSEYHNFRDGVYFIPLSACQPGSPLWPLMVEALHLPVREKQNPDQQVFDYLKGKHALLLFDSFEEVLDQAAWLSGLLQQSPQLTILVTSRSRLGISAEQVFTLGGMQVPGEREVETAEQCEAVQLFMSFVRRRQPEYSLDDKSRRDVAHLCQLVQGLPLGLLLAATWVELYTPEEITEQVERNLDFLEASWTDMPERQCSLRATFEYSWKLLPQEEQRLLAALAVFRGGFTLAAVEPVTGSLSRLIRSLIDKSLINRTRDGRHYIHDLVQQFASGKLEDDPGLSREIHARHSRYFLEALGSWEKNLLNFRQHEALEKIDREAENLRTAWRWAVTNQDWQGVAVGLEGMAWYADLRFRFEEGERACRTALEIIHRQNFPELSSALTIWHAHFLRKLGNFEQAGKLLQAELESLVMLRLLDEGIRFRQARVLYELGELNMYTNRDNAKDYYQQSLALFDEIDDSYSQALVLTSLGEAIHHTGPLDLAQTLLNRGVNLCRKLGDPRLLSRCILWNGWNQLRQGSLAQAEILIRESIEINRTVGDRYAEAFWSAELGTVKGWMGYFEEGIKLISSSIPIFLELGLKQEAILNILRRGLFETNVLEFHQASLDFQDCLTGSYELNYQRGIGLAFFGMGGVSLSDGDNKKAEELFLQALTILNGVQADEAGWCLALLVYTMRRTGDSERGWQYARQGLELAHRAHVYHSAAMTILGIAALMVDLGEVERALELQTLVMKYPLFKSSVWFRYIAGRDIEIASANLAPDVVKVARERGNLRELFTTVDELLMEFPQRAENNNLG